MDPFTFERATTISEALTLAQGDAAFLAGGTNLVDHLRLGVRSPKRVVDINDLGLDVEKVNVNGGAVGLGHPLAATGTRLVLTLAHELRRSGGRYGVATACIGGGQGIAMVLESITS